MARERRPRSADSASAESATIPQIERTALAQHFEEINRRLRQAKSRARSVATRADELSEISDRQDAAIERVIAFAKTAEGSLNITLQRRKSLQPISAGVEDLHALAKSLAASGRSLAALFAVAEKLVTSLRRSRHPSAHDLSDEVEWLWSDAGALDALHGVLSRRADELTWFGPLPPAEKMRRTRTRQRAGYVGRLFYDLHQTEVAVLRQMGLLPDREPTRDEAEEALRVFVRTALLVADIPPNDGRLDVTQRPPPLVFERIERMRRGAVDETEQAEPDV
jgi:hypothetical protein